MRQLKCHWCSRTLDLNVDSCSPTNDLAQNGWDWWEDMELFDDPVADGDDFDYKTRWARLHGICPTCQTERAQS